MITLVTGYAGQEHVTSGDAGSFNAALIGTGQYVLQRGSMFSAQTTSNNNVRISDGDILMQGRHIRTRPGEYIDLTIDNGSAGTARSDLIVVTYSVDPDTGIETAALEVIKGTEVTDGNPLDPPYTGEDIPGGDTYSQMPLYRVPLNGLDIQPLVPLFETLPTVPALKAQMLGEIHDIANQDLLPYTTGSYTGDGTASKYIALAFMPSFVLVFQQNTLGYLYSVNNEYTKSYLSMGTQTGVTPGLAPITDNGFTVLLAATVPSDDMFYRMNENNKIYTYIAFK